MFYLFFSLLTISLTGRLQLRNGNSKHDNDTTTTTPTATSSWQRATMDKWWWWWQQRRLGQGLETRLHFEPQVCFFLYLFYFCTNIYLQYTTHTKKQEQQPWHDDTTTTTTTTNDDDDEEDWGSKRRRFEPQVCHTQPPWLPHQSPPPQPWAAAMTTPNDEDWGGGLGLETQTCFEPQVCIFFIFLLY